MSEEQNIPEEKLTEETEVINQPSETIAMEVHHHPDLHHRRKRFREYFLEFLMIFFAVSMGFIAENIRESISENSKARELAESLYREVYSDSAAIQQKVKLRLRKEEEMVFLSNYLKDSNLTHLSNRFFPSVVWTFMLSNQSLFEPKDGIINQLKNSGTLRYFKSTELQNVIGNFNVAISRVRTRNEQEYSFVEVYTRPFVLKFFDFRWYDQFTLQGKLTLVEALNQNPYPYYPGALNNAAELKKQDAENLASYYLVLVRATRQLHYKDYSKANHELLEILRNEYHFKE